MSGQHEYHIAYALSALPSGQWARVLVLEPGEPGDPISATLQLQNLELDSDDGTYEAISYVWGDPVWDRPIRVDGHPMEITSSLFVALQNLRLRHRSRRLWADAICINQRDHNEKGKQVNAMGAIYSNAARVIIWAGPDPRGIAESVVSIIGKFNRFVETLVTPEEFCSRRGTLDIPISATMVEEFNHVQALFELPWFSRVWVMQEVGVSKEAIFAWGRAEVDFAEVVQYISSWASPNTKGQTSPLALSTNFLGSLFTYIWASYIPRNVGKFDKVWFKNSAILRQVVQTMRQKRVLAFEDIMYRCRHQLRATNPKDHVYAFLAHPTATTTNGRPIVDANYTISEAELRLRLFSTISQRSLRFLGLVWHTSKDELRAGPTWCPKFDSLQYARITGRYDASTNLSTLEDISAPGVESSSLHTSALLIDEVYLCGEIAGSAEKATGLDVYNALTPILNQIIVRYWLLAEQTNARYNSTYPDMPIAFASTLVTASGDEKDRVIAERFEEFCRDKCPSIHKHLQDGWLDKWRPSQPRSASLPFREWSASCIQSEKFFTTVKGYYGLGSPAVQLGDSICIIPTVQTPLVIRPVLGEELKYQVICSCYVYGMMAGEAVKGWNENSISMRRADIILV